MSRYLHAQSQLEMTEKDTTMYSELYRPPDLTSEQLEAFEHAKSELQKTRAQMMDVLNATVAEFAQSGLWHLAAEDGALETRLERKFSEMKESMKILKETTRALHGQIARGKHLPIHPPPGLPSLDSDMESGTEDDGLLPRKRRRGSPGESSTGDEDAIENELLRDDENLPERVASMETKAANTENMVTECQRDITQDIDERISDKFQELTRHAETQREERQAVFNSERQTLVDLNTHMKVLGDDVMALAGEVATQILVNGQNTNENTALRQENATLRADLETAHRRMSEVCALMPLSSVSSH